MALHRYGVLSGEVVDARREDDDRSPHYQIHVRAAGTDYRIAVNVKSQQAPSELLFLVDERFAHPLTDRLAALAAGFTALPPAPAGEALDYIRGNLFDRRAMQLLPDNVPGPDNDLSDRLAHYVERARREAGATIFAFGERWPTEASKPDGVFKFLPGNGIHDIHMNQGNSGRFRKDNGVWQDGGLIFHFPASDQWVGVFLAFQSQAWHTDDATGDPLEPDEDRRGPGNQPHPAEPDFRVRIVAALVNPAGPAPEAETVTLLNATPDAIDLAGWAVIDKAEQSQPLAGTLAAGATLVVPVLPPLALGNKGGLVTLVDAAGLKVDGVAYTQAQAANEGWTVVF